MIKHYKEQKEKAAVKQPQASNLLICSNLPHAFTAAVLWLVEMGTVRYHGAFLSSN